MNPRILVWDIECHTFRFKADQGFMLCCGFKEFGKPGVEILKRDNVAANPLNDKKLVFAIYEKLIKYDMWVTHNGKWFDVPWLNSRLMHYGHAPLPTGFPHFDTCEAAYKKMRIKNSLEAVGEFLGCKVKKTKTDMNDWLMAGGGNKKALETIVTHCEHDVKLTDEVYGKMRVLGFKHPNMGNLSHRIDACPICGAVGRLHRRGWVYHPVNKSPRFQCQACKGWSHGKPEATGVQARL